MIVIEDNTIRILQLNLQHQDEQYTMYLLSPYQNCSITKQYTKFIYIIGAETDSS